MVAVVLLPGMDGSGLLFAEFTSKLEARCIIVSYPPDQPLGYRDLQDLVRSRLPEDEPFILLAESFSGPVAIAIAANPPPQLKALVLVCTFAKYPAPSAALPLLQRTVPLMPIWRAPMSLSARVLLGRWPSSAAEASLMRAISLVAPAVWKTRLRSVLSVDETSSLCRIRAPTLYLRASEDRVVFSSASAVLSAHVPRIKVAEIEGPHFLLQSKPEESAAAVKAFAVEQGLAI